MGIRGVEKLDRYKKIVPDYKSFLDCVSTPLPQTLWFNLDKIKNPFQFHQLLEKKYSVALEKTPWCDHLFRFEKKSKPGTWSEFSSGLLHIQEEVSVIPAFLLDAKPCDHILDLCAAPGGKTAYLASKMNHQGMIVANDKIKPRLFTLRATLNRLGFDHLLVTEQDASSFQIPENLKFSKILTDVPCSCEGTLRKHPEILSQMSRKFVEKNAKTQAQILIRALEIAEDQSEIIYSTCTFSPEENERVVHLALEYAKSNSLEVELCSLELPGFQFSEGLTSWNGENFNPSLKNTMRVWPHQNNTGGFFVAKLKVQKTKQVDQKKKKIRPHSWEKILSPSDVRHFETIQTHFDFDGSFLSKLTFYKQGSKYLYASPLSVEPKDLSSLFSLGIKWMRMNSEVPRLCSESALLYGKFAQKNKLTLLSDEQARLYRQKQIFEIEEQQTRKVQFYENESSGQVIVSDPNSILGLGVVKRKEGRYFLESHYSMAGA